MVALARSANAFASVGIVPEDHGFRTVAEYRGRLFTVPSMLQPHQRQAEHMDAITPANNSSTATPQNVWATSQKGYKELRDTAQEAEDVLRNLARQIDVAGMAYYDQRFFLVLYMIPPMYLTNTPRAVVVRPTSTNPKTPVERLQDLFYKYWNGPKPQHEVQMSLLTWHWAADLVAVATGPHLDRICAFNFATGTWETSGQRMPNLSGSRCIAFRPFAGRSLAIGCDNGVFLMEGDKLTLLDDASHRQVLSLDWSPDGTKLAASSLETGCVRLWDIATRYSIHVDRGTIVKFSPGGFKTYLFVASAVSPDFRLWSCDTWKCERWGSLSGPVMAATWSKDGTTLLFSTKGESAIHVMTVGQANGSETRAVHSEVTALPREGPGGTPILMELDASGERLAVAYDVPHQNRTEANTSDDQVSEDPHRRFAVALYATQLSPTFLMRPIGYVNGPYGSGPPVALKFKANVESGRGAILSCFWKNGQLSFSQLAFNASGRK
ncbi:Aladin [Gracilariopsis chorda]|uniref:Aladin n=1 Tax=Gracilariopsis chorda TaxID=448386 RepID=A0A2V3IGZ4_9FLOR|nr:Aladin [Gracilariopsis chorda]|eukprot:PXF41376.1 Aladin [Gracilariopsis chorda]